MTTGRNSQAEGAEALPFPRWGVALAVVLGHVLRRGGMSGYRPTHWDEGLAWNGARWFAGLLGGSGPPGHYSPTHSPPLFSGFLGIVERLIGGGPGTGVLANACLSALALVLLARLAYFLSGRSAALMTAFLFAVSGLQTHYGRSLLTEPLYVTWLAAGLCASLTYLVRPSLARVALAGLCAAGLQLTKYNGVLLVVPLGAFLIARFLRGPRSPEDTKRGVVFLHGLVLGALPAAAIAANLFAIGRVGDLEGFLEHYSSYVGHGSNPLEVFSTLLRVTPPGLLVLGCTGLLVLLVRGGRELSGGCRSSSAARLFWIAFAVWAAFPLLYTFYLRLLAPAHALLLVAAGVGFTALVRGHGRAGFVTGWTLVLLTGFGEWRRAGFMRQQHFDAYELAAAEFERFPSELPLLCVTQQNVWPEMEREVVFAGLPSDLAMALLEANDEVLLAIDIHAFSKYGPRSVPRFFEALPESARITRIAGNHGIEVLENNLSALELGAVLEQGREAPRGGALDLHLYRLSTVELRKLVEAH